jgi:hypothetical protein
MVGLMTKRILAGAAALTTVLLLAACGDSELDDFCAQADVVERASSGDPDDFQPFHDLAEVAPADVRGDMATVVSDWRADLRDEVSPVSGDEYVAARARLFAFTESECGVQLDQG